LKEAFTLFLLALLIVPPLWGIRRVRRVLRMQAAERQRQEQDQ
jgi:heme exporter protein D